MGFLEWAEPKPAGFDKCRQCAYRETGPPTLCYECAMATFTQPSADCCPICSLPMDEGECGNPICSWPLSRRYFDRNVSIAFRRGSILYALNRYKYQGVVAWATIFARILAGFVEERQADLRRDIFEASPTFVSEAPGDRSWDHTGLVVQLANEMWGGFLCNRGKPVIVKTNRTTRMVGHNWQERRYIAEGELRRALIVPDPSVTRDKRILIYDDVFTEGFTLREVARCLIQEGGAKSVTGLSLVRQLFKR